MQSQATAAYPHVFETERDSGTPDKIRTCDLLLRRQTANTCYLQLRPGKWTLSGQKRTGFQESKGSNCLANSACPVCTNLSIYFKIGRRSRRRTVQGNSIRFKISRWRVETGKSPCAALSIWPAA